MTIANRDYPVMIEILHGQLVVNQADLARKPGVSFATLNRWGKMLNPSHPIWQK
jgi:hypothetical protein